MKTAVIFYSLDGNCALVAKTIKTQLNADMIRLQTKDEKKRKGIVKFFWAFGMVFKKRPKLKQYTFDPSAYDLIVIGTPVWASNYASPMKTFFADTPITGKKVALFACHASEKGNTLENMKTLLKENTIIGEIDFLNAAKNWEEVKPKLESWIKGLE